MTSKSDMKKHRLTVEEWRMIRKLRKEEEAKALLKKAEPVKDMIHVVIPDHYGSSGMIWRSRFITESQLDAYLAQYPSMQILDEKYKAMREEVQNDKTNGIRDQGIC